MGKKHCWKRRNCSLRAISPFPTVFSKNLCCRPVKTRVCWERVNFQKKYSNSEISTEARFSTLLKTNFNFWVTFILSSAIAFNLDKSRILSSGKKLIHMNPLPDEKFFRLVQIERNCRRHFKVH